MIIDQREIWLKDGEKLILKSPQPTDAQLMLDFLIDVATTSHRNLNHTADERRELTVEKEAAILETIEKSQNRIMISAYSSDGLIVGNIGCFGADGGHCTAHNARIGMGIRESYQNRGLGNQLMRTIMFEAEKLGFRRLELTVRTYNNPGIRLYENVGFKRIGTLSKVSLIDGEYVDEFMYEFIL